MNAIDVIANVKCPRCGDVKKPLDGKLWSLNNDGRLHLHCNCGYKIVAKLSIEVTWESSSTTFGSLAGSGRRA